MTKLSALKGLTSLALLGMVCACSPRCVRPLEEVSGLSVATLVVAIDELEDSCGARGTSRPLGKEPSQVAVVRVDGVAVAVWVNHPQVRSSAEYEVATGRLRYFSRPGSDIVGKERCRAIEHGTPGTDRPSEFSDGCSSLAELQSLIVAQ